MIIRSLYILRQRHSEIASEEVDEVQSVFAV
jgi:hypothetical protein